MPANFLELAGSHGRRRGDLNPPAKLWSDHRKSAPTLGSRPIGARFVTSQKPHKWPDMTAHPPNGGMNSRHTSHKRSPRQSSGVRTGGGRYARRMSFFPLTPAEQAQVRREMIADQVAAERAERGDRRAAKLEKLLFRMAHEQSRRDRGEA